MPLVIVKKDITKMKVDAIVNTTNESMTGISGVDYAIHTAAGEKLDKACEKLVPLGLGEAKITKGYNLPSKYVIHTSGPIWKGGLKGESVILRSCYLESLKLAVKYGCDTVAVPLISSGSYGYPKDKVLAFAVSTIKEFLEDNELTVYICVYDKTSYTFSKELYQDICDFICEEDSVMMEDLLSLESRRVDLDYFDDGAFCCQSPRNFDRDVHKFAKRKTLQEEKSTPKTLQEERILSGRNSAYGLSLEDYVRERDKGFAERLFDLIDEKGMTDVECYKKANVDRRTFSKIKSNPSYRPSKQTAVAFAISLELDLDETQELLSTLGFVLSRTSVFDKIIRYFIHNKNYDIFEINQALFEFDQQLLGM